MDGARHTGMGAGVPAADGQPRHHGLALRDQLLGHRGELAEGGQLLTEAVTPWRRPPDWTRWSAAWAR